MTKPTHEDVRKALADLRDEKGHDAVRKVLDTVGDGHQWTTLPESLFAAVIAAAKGKPAMEPQDGFSRIGRALNAAARARYAGRTKPRA